MRAEKELLASRGHAIITYYRHNDEIRRYGLFKKIGFIKTVFYSGRTVKELTAIIEKERPDVAHVHNLFPLISPSAYYCLKAHGIPVVQTVHNYRFLCPNGLFYRKGVICEKCKSGNTAHCFFYTCYRNSVFLSGLYALTFWFHRKLGTFLRFIDIFIALSNFAKDKLIEGGLPGSKIEVEGNFVAVDKHAPVYDKDSYALFLGRISPEKGIRTLLDAYKILDTLFLKIAGEGPLLERVKEYIKSNNIANVDALGFVSGSEKAALLGKAAVSIIPSEWYENFPMAVLESLAAGTPVIASRIGGLPELIEEGKNGLLFEPGNTGDLAAKIRYFYSNREIALNMSRYALESFEKRYSAGKHYEGLIQIYDKAIKLGRGRV